jgi:short-subunit dehydrogenase
MTRTTTDTTNGTRPLAVVTGASSGIGHELAKQFAAHGFDLLVTAEDERLDRAAAVLLAATSGTVTTVTADLRTPAGVENLYNAITGTGRPVAAAALNAGVGRGGAFVDTALADEQQIIDVNISSTVHLAKRLLRDMTARGEGRVLITSSIASTMPGSFQAVYNASKSFLQSFAEAVANELKDTGVTVTSLMPGPTETGFFHRADMDDTRVGSSDKDDPTQVAAQGFEALMQGKRKVVAGSLSTKASAVANAVLPDAATAQVHRVMAEPGSAKS